MYKTCISIVVTSVLFVGCTMSGPDPIMGLQLPNPASVYCIERGGSINIKESPQGDVTTCVLSDGTKIDEWAYYRQNHPKQ
jgi:putative hemolysin